MYGSVADYLDERSTGRPPRDMPGCVYLPNRLGHLQTYSTKLDRPGQYAGWLGRGYDPLATAIGKRNDTDNPFYRDCTDDELNFRIQGLAPGEGLTLDRLQGRRSLVEPDSDRLRRAVPSERRGAEPFTINSASGRWRWSAPKKCAPRSTFARNRPHCEIAMAATCLVNRRCSQSAATWWSTGFMASSPMAWTLGRRLQLGFAHVQRRREEAPGSGFGSGPVGAVDRFRRSWFARRNPGGGRGRNGAGCQGSNSGARNHWSAALPGVLAGAGVRGGIVYGTTDRDAAYALDQPTSPEDLATIFDSLGIDPHLRINDPQGRPVPLVDGGQVIREILA